MRSPGDPDPSAGEATDLRTRLAAAEAALEAFRREAAEALERQVRERTRELTLENERLREIEERYRALQKHEEELRQTRERFTAALQASPVAVFTQDLELRYTWICNPALGYQPAEVIGKTDYEMFERREDAERLVAAKRRVLETGRAVRQELPVVSQGVTRWYDLHVQLQRVNGQPVGVIATASDVTARRQAEEALRVSEEKFAKAFANNPAAIALTRLEDGVFLEVNETWTKLSGFSREEALGRSARTMGIWPRPEAAQRFVQELRAHGSLQGWEQEFFNKAGVPFMSELSAQILTVRGEDIVLSTLVDITARKRAEEGLRAAHDTFKHLVQHSPFGLYVVDADFRLIQVSSGAQKVFENVRPLLGRDFAEVLRLLWQEPFATEAVRQFRHTLDTGESYHSPKTVERRHDIPDTEAYDWRIDRITLPDGRAGVVCHFYDLSERRRYEEALRLSEEKFAKAFASNPAGIAISRLEDGVILDVNQTWLSVFGYQREEVIGRSTLELGFWPSAAARLRCVEELRKEGSLREWEQNITRRSGAQMVVLASFEVITLSSQRVVLSTWLDITERKQAQEVMARSKAELERLVEERTAKLRELVGELEHFSYTITHDMRSPLRAMRGYAELIEELCGPCQHPEQKALLRRIIASTERMDLLITDALSYSKAVRQDLPLGPVDVGRLIRGICDSYPEFQTTGACLEVASDIPLVLGNEAGLTQCFSNLLGNAVKFTRPDVRPQIRIRSQLMGSDAPSSDSQPGPAWVRLWVEDNGLGIAPSMLPRVFNMFSRGTHHHPGSGIGLALVRKVVDRMGGRVGVESEVGQGSRFWLELRSADSQQTPLPRHPSPPADAHNIL